MIELRCVNMMLLRQLVISFILLCSVSYAYTGTDYLKFDHNIVDFGSACTYYNVTSPTAVTTFNGTNVLGIASWVQVVGNVTSFHWDKLVVNAPYNVTTHVANLTCSNKTVMNKTMKVCIDHGYNNVTTLYANIWQPLNTSSITVNMATPLKVRFCGTYKMINGKIAIDHIPQIMGVAITNYTWWNATWSFRISNSIIDNVNENLTSYQIPLSLNTTNLYNAGKLNIDCSDIRVTYYNQSAATEMPIAYYIPNCITSDLTHNTTIWINSTSINTVINETYYIYYGNPSATNQSNGGAVFDIYDNTSSSSVDLSIWNKVGAVGEGSGTIQINGTNAWNTNGIYSVKSLDRTKYGYALNFSVMASSPVDAFTGWAVASQGFNFAPNDIMNYFDPRILGGNWYATPIQGSQDGGSVFCPTPYCSSGPTGFYVSGLYNQSMIIVNQTQGYTFQIDSNTKYSMTTDDVTGLLGIQFQPYEAGTSLNIANVTVRKYVFPEPSYIQGVEQNNNITNITPSVMVNIYSPTNSTYFISPASINISCVGTSFSYLVNILYKDGSSIVINQTVLNNSIISFFNPISQSGGELINVSCANNSLSNSSSVFWTLTLPPPPSPAAVVQSSGFGGGKGSADALLYAYLFALSIILCVVYILVKR